VAGNRKLYLQALREGHNLAWDGQWTEAAAAYRRAVEEFPDDVMANTSLGMAYLRAGAFQAALEVYQRLDRLTPDDPTVLETLASLLTRMGEAEQAAQTCVRLAQIHWAQRRREQATQAWEQAVALTPDNLAIRQSLAEAYVQQAQIPAAIEQYLALADIYHRRNQTEKAIRQCQRALELDPNHPGARAFLEALRYGREGLSLSEALATVRPVGHSPVDQARQQAQAEVAELVLESLPTEAGIAPPETILGQALDYQARGLIEQAIKAYETAIQNGVQRPVVHFILGLLLLDRFRFNEAVAQLSLVQEPKYALASRLAMGECYRAQGRLDKAFQHFVEAARLIDLSITDETRAEALSKLYGLIEASDASGKPEQAVLFISALTQFLSHPDWEDRTRQIRQRLDSLAEEGMDITLAEILQTPHYEEVLESLLKSQEYKQRDLLTLASEECYRGIEKSPYFLPLHLALAEVLLKEGRFEAAMTKYQVVADTFLVRGELPRAASVYHRILKIAPMDITTRARLAEMLINLGRIEDALTQYVALGDACYKLAQLDKALESYQRALPLAARSANKNGWTVHLLHLMADIYLQRVEWMQAISAYRKILELDPQDERARLALMDLYFKQNEARQAIAILDELLQRYHQQGADDRMVSVLQEAAKLQPSEIAIRARLARAYLKTGQREQALQELEALGDLQLEAGQTQAARETLRLLIRLSPEQASAYQQLLATLEG